VDDGELSLVGALHRGHADGQGGRELVGADGIQPLTARRRAREHGRVREQRPHAVARGLEVMATVEGHGSAGQRQTYRTAAPETLSRQTLPDRRRRPRTATGRAGNHQRATPTWSNIPAIWTASPPSQRHHPATAPRRTAPGQCWRGISIPSLA